MVVIEKDSSINQESKSLLSDFFKYTFITSKNTVVQVTKTIQNEFTESLSLTLTRTFSKPFHIPG